MNEGSLGKSVCTAVAAGCESQKDLEDLADLADTYFLGPQQLARELTDVQAALSDRVVDLSPRDSPHRSGIETSLPPAWNENDQETVSTDKNAAGATEDGHGCANLSTLLSKAMTEPMDSSDWDQTQERFGSQAGGPKPLNHSTESPESVLNTRADPSAGANDVQRRNSGSQIGLQQPDTFLPRDGSSNALDPDQAQGPMHSYSQMLGLGDEAGGPKGRQGEGLWEGRGSSGGNNFHSPSFPGVQHQGPGRHGGVVSGEPSQRMQPGRGSWSNGDPPGGMDDGAWEPRFQGKPQNQGLSRMLSDTSMVNRFAASPVKRQYSEDLYDVPRGSLNLFSGPGASPLDAILGEAELPRSQISPTELRRAHRRAKSHGIPPQSPANRAAMHYYHPPVPGTPADGTRKRRREAFYQLAEQDGQQLAQGSRGRLAQEDLIGTLKQQIAGLDQQTKSLMKMTLYRISRNANSTADGVREWSQQNPRNAYLDKVVANFMYNRFSRSAASRPNYMSSGSHLESGGYFNRSCSSPDMSHPNQGLDMEL